MKELALPSLVNKAKTVPFKAAIFTFALKSLTATSHVALFLLITCESPSTADLSLSCLDLGAVRKSYERVCSRLHKACIVHLFFFSTIQKLF